MPDAAYEPVTVVLDWGTTNFRAFLVKSDGSIVDEKIGDRGIQSVTKGEHARVVSEGLASWRAEYGPLDIVAAGMIGSRNGWIEMPYVPT
ncbi:2-dehydro-3-deoxygalactonokinase, partial [Sinorhizobium medicae]